MVLEETLESPLNYMEIKPVNPKGYQPKIFIAKTNAKAPILWPPDVTDLLEKTMFLGKIEGRKKGRHQYVARPPLCSVILCTIRMWSYLKLLVQIP